MRTAERGWVTLGRPPGAANRLGLNLLSAATGLGSTPNPPRAGACATASAIRPGFNHAKMSKRLLRARRAFAGRADAQPFRQQLPAAHDLERQHPYTTTGGKRRCGKQETPGSFADVRPHMLFT